LCLSVISARLQLSLVAAAGSTIAAGVAAPPAAGGNKRCWSGHFTHSFCCNASLPSGNPDCWDKYRYTYENCCLRPDGELPPAGPPPNPEASRRWRVTCGKDLGGWMVHELAFYEDDACERRVRRYAQTLDSGHRKGFPPGNAFDQWVHATDEYFWYSLPADRPGGAWLGLEFVRPTEVRCIGLWHNNIPAVPVTLQRWDKDLSNWSDVHHWPVAQGGEWAMLVRDPKTQVHVEQDLAEL